MNSQSQYCLKYRVDLLGAHILDKYGGIWLSPGTIIYKPNFYNDIFSKLNESPLLTFGNDPNIINNCNLEYQPNNMVIAAKKNNIIINLYKMILDKQQQSYQLPPDVQNIINSDELKDIIDTTRYNLLYDELSGVYAIAEAFRIAKNQEFPFEHMNYGCLCDGMKNANNKNVTINELLSYHKIYFANENQLLFISTPYYELYNKTNYLWFYNMSEKQFYESPINVVNYVKESLKKINNQI